MITICHAADDIELLFLHSMLEDAGIPYSVVGRYFGSLYPGVQVPWYNERCVRVPEALKVIEQVRSSYTPTYERLTIKSKLRMILEGLCIGWVVPGGTKKPSNNSEEPTS
jgi:hypothetical protein